MADKQQHTEATCLAFSNIHLNGMKWSITIRQGVTQKDIDGLLDKIAYLAGAAAARGFRFPGIPKAEEKKEEQQEPDPPRQTGPKPKQQTGQAGTNASDNPIRVGSFKVTGTKENPVVELYSANKKLKFPVLRPPFSVLESVVHRGYQDLDISALSDCGKEGKVDWEVGWEVSPKNPKWRDLVSISIPKLGPPRARAEPTEEGEPRGEDEIPF